MTESEGNISYCVAFLLSHHQTFRPYRQTEMQSDLRYCHRSQALSLVAELCWRAPDTHMTTRPRVDSWCDWCCMRLLHFSLPLLHRAPDASYRDRSVGRKERV